jgi:hypothetical protein
LWFPQLVLHVPKPLQRNVQLPPGHVKVQSAPSEQVMSQPPPAQSPLQVDWSLQVYSQSPPAQCELHVALPAQRL